jgi:hypothetical protein
MSSNAIKQLSESAKTNKGGAPKGNENAAKHRLSQAKTALTRFGSRAINKRKKPGLEWKRIYTSFVSEILGESVEALMHHSAEAIGRRLAGTIGQAQAAQVEMLATELWTIRSIDAYIVSLDSTINKQAKTLLPIIRERNELVAAYDRRRRNLHKLQPRRVRDDEPRLEDEFGAAESEDE